MHHPPSVLCVPLLSSLSPCFSSPLQTEAMHAWPQGRTQCTGIRLMSSSPYRVPCKLHSHSAVPALCSCCIAGATVAAPRKVLPEGSRPCPATSHASAREVQTPEHAGVVGAAGEMLHAAEPFLERNLHPTVIIRGYVRALEDALAIVDSLAFPIDTGDRTQMLKIISSCIGTKFTSRFGTPHAGGWAAACSRHWTSDNRCPTIIC